MGWGCKAIKQVHDIATYIYTYACFTRSRLQQPTQGPTLFAELWTHNSTLGQANNSQVPSVTTVPLHGSKLTPPTLCGLHFQHYANKHSIIKLCQRKLQGGLKSGTRLTVKHENDCFRCFDTLVSLLDRKQ